MAILKSHIKLLSLLASQNTKVIKGNALSVSQQAVYENLESTKKILKDFNVKIKDIPKGFDIKNKIKSWDNTKYSKNINIKTLLKLLGVKKTITCDVSNYEDPDLIIDLNRKVKKNFHENFDLILDFGTLEHVFDVPQALENYVKMTKLNGHIAIAVPCSNMIDHSFYMFSPTLFYDYFLINGFKIIKSYLRVSSPYIYNQKSIFYEYLYQDTEIPILPQMCTEVIIIAKKVNNINKISKPTQFVYQKDINWIKKNLKIQKYKKNNSLKHIIKSILINKFTPFFIHKYFFYLVRGKNIKKIEI